MSIDRTLAEGAGAGRTGRTPGVAWPSARKVLGPAMPSAASRFVRWYRSNARAVAASKNPYTGTSWPRRASMYCSTETSQPKDPRWRVLRPNTGVPSGPSARRVAGPARPSGTRPTRRWNAFVARTVCAPAIASIGPL